MTYIYEVVFFLRGEHGIHIGIVFNELLFIDRSSVVTFFIDGVPKIMEDFLFGFFFGFHSLMVLSLMKKALQLGGNGT